MSVVVVRELEKSKARIIDQDLNLTRILFFIIGVMTGVAMTVILYTRPMATHNKLIYNNCGYYADHTSKCGHGSPDLNPGD
jgi:hypothetical protein